MSTSKKRKVAEEFRSFQEKWTNDYFFVQINGKPVCLVCGDALGVMKTCVFSLWGCIRGDENLCV